MKIRSLFGLLALFASASGCANHSIDEQKAVGSWQVVSPNPPLVAFYQFNADHTWSTGIQLKPGSPIRISPPCGHWRLEGSNLVMDLGLSDTNNAETTSFLKSNPVTFRIASATETSMVLHDDVRSLEMTWKKINQ
jgi:hypothetical protein